MYIIQSITKNCQCQYSSQRTWFCYVSCDAERYHNSSYQFTSFSK